MHRPEDRSAPPIDQRSLPADDLAGAEQLVALSHDLMGAVDVHRRLVWTNPAWKAVLGWEPEELAGVVYSDLLHPDDRPAAANAERALLAGAGRWPEAEFRVRSRRGDYRLILWSGVAAPERALLYVSGKDITELRRHEQTMASRAEELERSNQELAQFAYVASHDLSEPLRTISSYLQLLRRRYHGQIDDDADAFIGYAVEGAARMRTLIEDLLTYSRAGRSTRPPAEVDTGQVVADVAATLRAQAAGEPPLIESGELPAVIGDAAQLTQLFQNLIGNGVKFVAPGTRPHVRVGAAREEGSWRFTVDDNGIGIEPRHLERVFGMFQRLQTRDEFPGTGIGLAIAKKVVEQHHGTIRAAARPEGGTRFEFTLADPPEAA
jgi:PAS domain S-box-containing protein